MEIERFKPCSDNDKSRACKIQIIIRYKTVKVSVIIRAEANMSQKISRDHLFLKIVHWLRGTQRLFSVKYLFGEANIA